MNYINIIKQLKKESLIISGKTPYQFQINKDIFQKYKDYFINISEMLYCFKNDNILNEIFCKCGNKKNFINMTIGYTKFCSKECNYKYRNFDSPFKRKDVQEKSRKTFQIKYNSNTFAGTKLFKEKSKLTKLERYNDENYNNSKQANKTKYERYENHAYNKNKFEQSMLEIYGVTHHWKDKNVRKQIINTMLNNIDENGLNSIQRRKLKIEQTNLEKYGVKCSFSSKDPEINGRASIKRKYGVESFWSSQQFKDLYKDEEYKNKVQEKAIQTRLHDIDENGLNSYQRSAIKRFETMKKNNSFNTSQPEEECYQLLLKKFSKDDIERQYKSQSYPFHCDFYIKSLDLYIEYHGTWTHQFKPFKHSVEDLQKLKELQNKNTKYYNTSIEIWTKIDPLKLQTFKKNKLNFKIFYNIEQFKNWFNKI